MPSPAPNRARPPRPARRPVTAPRTSSPIDPALPGTATQGQPPTEGRRPLPRCATTCTRSSNSAPPSRTACRASARFLQRRRASQATRRGTWHERRPRPAGTDGVSHQPYRTSHICGQYARHIVAALEVATSRTDAAPAHRRTCQSMPHRAAQRPSRLNRPGPRPPHPPPVPRAAHRRTEHGRQPRNRCALTAGSAVDTAGRTPRRSAYS